MSEPGLEPKYETSHALVIGINSYQNMAPLGCAVNDAEAIARLLQDRFDFETEKTHVLLDDKATRAAIQQEFLSFASEDVGINDRLFVFFAGHGHTVRARKGEVGYLIPSDGNLGDLSSLIRWDDLTRNADLIPAKHILFVMDACYGGLATMRGVQPGSMRFLKDMYMRHSRQVLTAGKADEVVADLGGPLPDHSIFTGHLLQALEGGAADSNGIITANGVMAYVYRRVGQDPDSNQTPHFGFLDGDGDFVFAAPAMNDFEEKEGEDQDILVPVPAIQSEAGNEVETLAVEKAKKFLADPNQRINLHSLVATESRRYLSLTSEDHFPIRDDWSAERFNQRVDEYESAARILCEITALTSRWAGAVHRDTLSMIFKQLSGRLESGDGQVVWARMRWYPIMLLSYSAAIGALATRDYGILLEILHTNVANPTRSFSATPLVLALGSVVSDTFDAFKTLPGLERNHTPRSDHLYKRLQPWLDDLLFLGVEYEALFDEFEVLLALEHAYLYSLPEGEIRIYGPLGRFGWKFFRSEESSPFHRLVAEATSKKDMWPPLAAGFFGGSFEEFEKTATGYSKRVAKLAWF